MFLCSCVPLCAVVDLMDDLFESNEQEEDAVVQSVLDEIGIQIGAQVRIALSTPPLSPHTLLLATGAPGVAMPPGSNDQNRQF